MTRIKTVRERTSIPSQLAGIVAVAVPPLGLVAAVWLLWNRGVHPVDLALLTGFYVACGLGITVGFHRLFTHKSFETSAPLRALWAILGSMAMQGPLTQRVTDHRKHHALSDRPGDPHSPHAGHGDSLAEHVLGLWHSHIGWLFSTKGLERGVEYGHDLYEDRLVRGIDRLYLLWVALTLGLPFLAGYLVGGSWQRGLEAMVWAGLVRIFLFQHVTFSINSICHFFGNQPFRTRDERFCNGAYPAPTTPSTAPESLRTLATWRGTGTRTSRESSSTIASSGYCATVQSRPAAAIIEAASCSSSGLTLWTSSPQPAPLCPSHSGRSASLIA